MKTLPIEPIGSVRGGRNAMTDDGWGSVRAAIELDTERFSPDSVAGLDAFIEQLRDLHHGNDVFRPGHAVAAARVQLAVHGQVLGADLHGKKCVRLEIF